MAGQATTPYKKTLSGSIGAGMGSLFAPGGKKYYILEHKVSSKYHRAGESQEIIVDNIELGRDSHCQVRFDESFQTVSRHHAAIVRDGEMWKLVQISKTNSTFLNGRPIKTEWYLQNGDEIQLSVNGPKLGFILPTGKKSTVGSIGLTRRLSLFRQQALRPYKTAITALSCMLLVASLGGGYVMYEQSMQLKDNTIALDEARRANEANERLIAEQKKIIENQGGILDSLKKVKPRTIVINKNVESSPVDMSSCYPYVYHMTAHVIVEGKEVMSWLGTGFQLNDGKFVTARHVVTPYYSNNFRFTKDGLYIYPNSDPIDVYKELLINAMTQSGKVEIKFDCVSPTNSIQLSMSQFNDVSKYDEIHTLSYNINLVMDTRYEDSCELVTDSGIKSYHKRLGVIPAGTQIRSGAMGAIDFAYAMHNSNGGLKANRQLSSNMKQGTKLHVLGYPHGWGKGKPFYSSAVCAQDGINQDKGLAGTIIVSNNNTEGGNSGGPIFVQSGSDWEVVAIVSGSNQAKGRFVPISVIP